MRRVILLLPLLLTLRLLRYPRTAALAAVFLLFITAGCGAGPQPDPLGITLYETSAGGAEALFQGRKVMLAGMWAKPVREGDLWRVYLRYPVGNHRIEGGHRALTYSHSALVELADVEQLHRDGALLVLEPQAGQGNRYRVLASVRLDPEVDYQAFWDDHPELEYRGG